MPTVTDFVEKAKAALLQGDTERAAEVCRHILSYYPKQVEATCLLAEALRDQGETSLARDLYLRVVSADPNNLIAHWALGLIAEAENDPEWALWELQRAYESNPGHVELRQELQRLGDNGQSMTEFALAQIHVANGLTDKAVDEFRRILAAEPNRLDVAVALAETLWRDGQTESAAKVCETILEDSPDCLRANLLLGCYLFKGPPEGREKGKRLLQRALALDPTAAVASVLLSGQNVPEVVSPPVATIPDLPDDVDAETDDLESGLPTGIPVEVAATESRSTVGAGAAQHGRSRGQSDIAGWLQDEREQKASVQEVLQARLASQAAQRPDADWQALEGLDPEWQDLLNDDITLDQESEERLAKALSEMGLSQGGEVEEGWVEVPVTTAGAHGHLSKMTRGHGAPAQSSPSREPGPGPQRPGGDDDSGPAPRQPSSAPGPAEPPDAQPKGAGPEWAGALWQGGDPEAALEEYRRILAVTPEAAETIADGLKGLMRAYPDLAAAHRMLGDAYMRSGRFQQAIEEYNWVLSNRGKEA